MSTPLILILVCLGVCQAELTDPESTTCLAASQDESINGEPLAGLVESLNKKEFRQQRLHAMELLARWAKTPQPYIPAFLEALKDSDHIVRATSAQCLGYLGNRLPSLVGEFLPQLSAAFDDPQQPVRAAVAHALADLGPAARSELPALRRHYQQDKDPLVRELALHGMVAATQGSNDHLDALLTAVNQNEFRINQEWLRSLSRVGQNSPEAVAAIRQVLERRDERDDSSFSLRYSAAVSLGAMGPAASAAVPNLFAILKEPIQYRNVYAPAAPGEPIQSRLIGKDPTTFLLRLVTAWAIMRADPQALTRLFDLLNEQLADPNPDLRLSSAIIVSRLSYLPAAKRTLPAVKILANDPDPNVRTIARLAALRLADPDFQGQDEGRLTELPLPKDNEPKSSPEARQLALKSKLDELKMRSDAGDYVAVMRSLMLPSQFEKALLQGDLVSQMARDGQRKSSALLKTFDQAQFDKLQINDRLATLPTAALPRPLRFHWFAGEWYLSNE